MLAHDFGEVHQSIGVRTTADERTAEMTKATDQPVCQAPLRDQCSGWLTRSHADSATIWKSRPRSHNRQDGYGAGASRPHMVWIVRS